MSFAVVKDSITIIVGLYLSQLLDSNTSKSNPSTSIDRKSIFLMFEGRYLSKISESGFVSN